MKILACTLLSIAIGGPCGWVVFAYTNQHGAALTATIITLCIFYFGGGWQQFLDWITWRRMR